MGTTHALGIVVCCLHTCGSAPCWNTIDANRGGKQGAREINGLWKRERRERVRVLHQEDGRGFGTVPLAGKYGDMHRMAYSENPNSSSWPWFGNLDARFSLNSAISDLEII
ncbi:hypothetical protein FA13DRAFT_598558 [Coprinellus micaceus]|uniref:Secreted protein n=1 Tax=Coprinellus micaceus TaxID=71717 RepID=A0A4Y7T7C9_COPMI|nr:hypothetical protein FA13DRAFT_598558 [Coprinellus micaceus]